MNKLYGSGDHYRERAEECRTLAEWLTKEELRKKMLKTADDYERMAEVADWLVITKGNNEARGGKV